jgi:hypothetical protein
MRTKGWRLPAQTICVTRPGKWGNPFRVGHWFKIAPDRPATLPHFALAWEKREGPADGFTRIENHAMAVEWFSRCVAHDPKLFLELRGKNLACWCPPEGPCHGNVLLKLANPT